MERLTVRSVLEAMDLFPLYATLNPGRAVHLPWARLMFCRELWTAGDHAAGISLLDIPLKTALFRGSLCPRLFHVLHFHTGNSAFRLPPPILFRAIWM